ncbi:MAG: N-acetylornithine carbamoyltransferase [Bacteroidetes bacterium]|nr:N-acetylornithine carbamoyltransferase [Bacteroidota bacterium]
MKRFTDVHSLHALPDALQEALALKADPWAHASFGARKTLGLLFMNPSLRTRMSTQKAAALLGMDVMVLNAGSDSWTLETRDGVVMDGGATEHIKEAAAVMGQYCDILGVRTFAGLQDRDADYREDVMESFIRYAGVPVISLESATRHPLQSFADLITIETTKKVARPRVVLTWAPHPKALPQAVANSFVEWMRHAEVDLVVTHPHGYELAPEFVDGVHVEYDQDAALDGADYVYAKNWSSYTSYGQILSSDRSWTVTEEKMRRTNNARFMHCLPVRRNMIVTDGVLDGPSSIVIEQAGNRVVSAQTVLLQMLKAMP